jgi:hypothetical protein
LASVKISELPAASTLSGSETVPVVQNGVTVGASVSLWSPVVNTDRAATVATLAALKALTTRPEVVIVETGQAKGLWQWELGSSTTADDGVVVTPTSGTAGRYKRVYDGAINLMWYGADNTGNTDIVSALTAAVAALPSAGGAIYVPRGSYKMSSSFAPTKTGLSIYGDGWGNTIFIPGSDFAGAMFDLQGYAQTISGIQINATQGALTITGTANNGSGLIRLTMASTASLTTGQKVMVDAVTGTTEANGSWTITVVDATHVDLQGSTFSSAWVSGGLLLRYVNVIGIKTSASAANTIVENVFFAAIQCGLWTAAGNDGRFRGLRMESCNIGLLSGQGGASVYASELHYNSIAMVPFGQQGSGLIIDYNSFSNQYGLITVQGAQTNITIQSTQAHNGTTLLRPNGHYFYGKCNFDHAELAACSITSGWRIEFEGGTLTGCQTGPGLLIDKSGSTANEVDGIKCEGVYIGGNGTHGVQAADGANLTLMDCDIYGNSVVSAGTYDGVNVAAAFVGQVYLKGNMYGPSAANTGGWGGLTASQRYAIVLASTALSDVADYGSVGVTLKGRLYIDEPYSVQTTGFLLDASAPTGLFKFIAPLVSYNVGNVVFIASSVDFNSANTDTAIPITLPIGYTRYFVTQVRIASASASLTTATCGVFSATAAGGTAIVASGTAITVSTASENTANNAQSLTVATGATQSLNFATLYFRVQTPQGSAATGNVIIAIVPVP